MSVNKKDNRVWLGCVNQKVLLTLASMQEHDGVHTAQWEVDFPLEQINPRVKTLADGSIQVEFQAGKVTKISVDSARSHYYKICFAGAAKVEINRHNYAVRQSRLTHA